MTEGGEPLPRLHRASLRLRITLLTALVVAIAVALGGVLILRTLDAELRGAADDVGKERAQEITGLAATGRLPTPLPEMEDPKTPAVVVSDGRVVTATPGLDDPRAFGLPERPVGDVAVLAVPRLPLDAPGPYRVVAQGVRTPTGPATVYVAVPIHDVEHALSAATRIGGIGLLLLIGVLTWVMWLAIGRALAPVNAIRVRADAISGRSLDLRVPTPPRQDEIGRLARTVNQMLGRLEASAESQRRFVADAAHELRSPIASLRMQLETASERDLPAERDRVDDMLHETARMESLVDQLLLLARAGSEGSWLRLSTVDLDDIVHSAIGSLRAEGVTVDTTGVAPVQLVGDGGMLEQVVRNLVQNAVARAGSTVAVSLSTTPAGEAVLVVDDDGPGVPVDRRTDIFERFVRLDHARDRGQGGVGLGLAIVAEIVRAHQGRIHVADAPLGGARFVVELPLAGPGTEA